MKPLCFLWAACLLAVVNCASAADDVIISEFMAQNKKTLADEDGTFSDWIELHNRGVTTVNLDGWFLSDTTNLLTKWRIPATNLTANAYMVIFASGKDRANPGAQLHTNFRLDGAGQYLALIRPDMSIAAEFAPVYPPQLDDISYGDGTTVTVTKLVATGAAGKFLVPSSDVLGTNWIDPAFNDATWTNVTTGIGYSVPTNVSSSLYAYWPVKEGTGNIISNLAPGGVSAVNSSATWVTDPERGTVLSFNGTSSYVSAGTIPRLAQATSSFTWSLWYKLTAAANGNVIIAGNRNGGTQSPLQFVKITASNFEYYRGAPAGNMPYAVPMNQWMHLVVVKNGAALTYYANGKVVASSTAGGDMESNPFYWGGDATAGENSGGLIDEVALWTDALTPAQVTALYSGASPLNFGYIDNQIATSTKAAMYNVNASAYLRLPFNVSDTATFNTLKLRVKYDDGFVAYLNGVEVARRNAPATLSYNSAATAEHPDAAAVAFEDVDITGFLNQVIAGPNVLSFQGLNLSAGDHDFLLVPELEGNMVTGVGERYMATPTPGAVNNLGVIGYVAGIKWSHHTGFYDTNFQVTITCATPGATIRYTTNGTPPMETNGVVYSGPIPVSGTTVLRASAYRPGWEPAPLETQTYLYMAGILAQTATGWPAPWGGIVADYAMDPRVVTNALYKLTITNDMKALPVMCITVDTNEFFGTNGIYVNSTGRGDSAERAASFEMFFPDGSRKGFNVNCGIRIAGGASRTMTPKHSLRVLFKSLYGPSKLNYKVFDDSDVNQFDALQLRPNFNMSWVRTDNSGPLLDANANGAERTHAIYVRDQFTKDSQLDMGQLSAHQRFVHLYINGMYWGVYNPGERNDTSFAATYLGGDKVEYDAIFSDPNSFHANGGDAVAWTTALALANAGLTNAAQYAEFQKFVDVTNLADYMMLNFYLATVDWPWQNWNAVRKRETNATFKFLCWDAEYTLETPPWVPNDVTSVGNAAGEAYSPARMYSMIRSNAEWRLLFADRAQKHFFNNGALTTNQATARFLALCNKIDRAIIGESARWGDVVRTTAPYTREDWLAEKTRLLTQFFNQRTTNVIQQFRGAGLYPSVYPPAFSQFGAVYSNRFNLTISAPAGVIYYTTNGADPRLPGGAIAPDALIYSSAIPMSQSLLVRARAYYTNTWSALTEAPFIEATPIPLRITEVMFNPALPPAGITNAVEDFQYIELRNIGSTPVNLTGVQFTRGATFVFPNGSLAPGDRIFVVKNRAAFEARYGTGFAIGGEMQGKLSANGETLRLEGALGELIQEFTYSNWYPLTDGLGFAITAVNETSTTADWSNRSSWRVGTPLDTARGLADPIFSIAPIVVNEVLSRTIPPMIDLIELFNPTTNYVYIGGWYLTDDPNNPFKFQIPADTLLYPGGFHVFGEGQYNAPGAATGFGLSGLGDALYLYSADAQTNLTGYSHGFAFGAAADAVSFGRHVNSDGTEDFPAQIAMSIGATNAGPRIGPVVITEVMYHPAQTNDVEYVEIQNISSDSVLLYDLTMPTNTWRLKGAGFDFPTNVSMNPGEMLLVVNSDPATFRAQYSIPATVQIYGPFGGTLQNGGESLALQYPDAPTLNNNVIVIPYIDVDVAHYNNNAPWPTYADGTGPSLQRITPSFYGNEPTNWLAATPSPGRALSHAQAPTIVSAPASRSVVAYLSTVFNATVTGAAPMRYQWRLNGTPIPGATGSVLMLTNIQPTQAGFYTVVAYNDAGLQESAPAQLTVLMPATILAQPQSLIFRGSNTVANYGLCSSNATFSVQATSTTAMSYQWRFNGANIPNANAPSITIPNTGLANDGTYDVVITDGIGPVTSQPATLTVLVTPLIVQAALSQSVVQGSDFVLSVSYSGYPRLFTNEWRQGSTVKLTEVTDQTVSYFRFTNIQVGATYRFVVKNQAYPLPGAVSSAIITMLPDSDGDGIPDAWEIAYGMPTNSPANALLDSDGDGMSNKDEYIAGTNPTNALSYLRLDMVNLSAASGATFQFQAVSNRTYSAIYEDSLIPGRWSVLTNYLARATNRFETVQDPNYSTNRFYRIKTPAL